MRAPTRLTSKAGIEEILAALELSTAAMIAADMRMEDVVRIEGVASRYRHRLEEAGVRRKNIAGVNRHKGVTICTK
jgi:hypothetical protein